MTNTTHAVDEPTFDTSTATGRLRILWGATADPQLAMSDDEVADVATVLREHAEMAAELERLRTERHARVDVQFQDDVDIFTGTVDHGPISESTRSLIAMVTSHVATNEVSADYGDADALAQQPECEGDE